MTRRTIAISESRESEWDGNKGPNKFKGKAHKIMVGVFILGILAIVAIGIYIGVDLRRQNQEPAATKPLSTTIPSTTTTTSSGETSDAVVLARLRQAVSSPDQVYISNFTNWDGTIFIPKVFMVSPTNANEIQNLVRAALDLNLKIRPVGSGMSYSNLFPDEGQIQLQTKLLRTRADGQSFTKNDTSLLSYGFPTLSVAAGITLGELTDYFVANDIELISVPVSRGISVTGAISTAAHGVSLTGGGMGDQVVGFRYVDGKGELRTASTENMADLIRMRCCLGLCGIIYDVVFKVDPITTAKVVQGFQSGEMVIKNQTHLRSLVTENKGLALFYAPLSALTDADWAIYQSTGRIPPYDLWQDEWWYRIVEEAPSTSITKRRRRSADQIPPLMSHVMPGTLLGDNVTDTETTESPGSGNPQHTALLLHKYAYEISKAMVEAEPVSTRPFPEAITYTDANDLSKTLSVSLAIPDNQFIVLERALEIAFGLLEEYRGRGQVPILTIEVRWIAASPECVLCAGSFTKQSVDHVLTMEFISASYKPSYYEYTTRMIDLIRQEWPSARLEWAKFSESLYSANRTYSVDNFLKESRRAALDVMRLGNSSVSFWDVFTSQLLSKVIDY